MQWIKGLAAACAVWGAACGAALADEKKEYPYTATIRSGVGYDFPEEFGIPSVNQSSIDSSFTLAGTIEDWTLSGAYLETKDNDEGLRVRVRYGPKDCPLIAGDVIGCNFHVQYQDVGDGEVISYTAGVGGPIGGPPVDGQRFRPTWNANVSANAGDVSNTTVGGGVAFEYGAFGRWTFTGAANIVYAVDPDDTLPNWALGARYDFNDRFAVTVGYESRPELTDDEDDPLEVRRAAYIELKYKFGPNG